MLTWAERLIMWNQYEIIKHLKPNILADCEMSQYILETGIEQFYSEMNPSVEESVIDKVISREVENILSMYRAIHFSCIKLNYTPSNHWGRFQGFDANNEHDHYRFANFVRGRLGRWQELAYAPENSHSSTLSHYREMYDSWNRRGSKGELTASDIEDIANCL